MTRLLIRSDRLVIRSDGNPRTFICKRRRRLVRDLPPIEQLLRGTLVETYKRCGRPNCHCVDGPGHGPKRYLSISQPGGRPRRDYVPNNAHLQVAQLIDNFRKLRQALNAELLRRREDLG
jgi:hypothetical protein